ncbi:MAG: HDOD domain-containing protein [Planctomycetota bacterium]
MGGVRGENSTASVAGVEVVLSQIDGLPTLPAVAVRLLTILASERSSSRDVLELIRHDASMTAGLLRYARRANVGIPPDCTDLSRIVSLLGFTRVRHMVLAVHVQGLFDSMDAADRRGAIRRELWKHSLAVGCAAEMLAELDDRGLESAEAFVCGLLHDLGKIALEACFPKAYARVIEKMQSERVDSCDAERSILHVDHVSAGKRLASRWQLPQAVIDSVGWHHQDPDTLPSTVQHADMVRLIRVADGMVNRLRIGPSVGRTVVHGHQVAESSGISEEDFARIARKLPERLAPFAELLSLDAVDTATLFVESMGRANRELGQLHLELMDSQRLLESRSTYLEAILRFNELLTPDEPVSGVCRASAKAVRPLLSSDGVMVYGLKPNAEWVVVGWANAEGGDGADVVVPNRLSESLMNFDSGWAPTAIAKAEPWESSVWQQAVGMVIADPLWRIPLRHGDRTIGGVIFPAPAEHIRDLTKDSNGYRALVSSLGLALVHAEQLSASEQTNEELLHLHRQLSAMKSKLARERSISMVAEMAAGAAHELGNPLAVVSGRAQMVRAQSQDAGIIRAMDIIVEHVNRASGTVSDLMSFAKPEAPQPTPIGVHELLESVSQHWRQVANLSASQLQVDEVDRAARVVADAKQVRGAIDAVMANAVKACEGREAHIEINSSPGASDETVRIVIEDRGAGMTPEVLEHAVDPFFSHRSAGRGRGLGLSRAVRLIGVNGGSLWIDSTPDVGTKVTLELPRWRDEPVSRSGDTVIR